MTDLSIAADPFATDFERAYPHRQLTVRDEEVTEYCGPVAPRGPVDPDDAMRREALNDDFRWNQMVIRQISKTRMTWTEAEGWHMVPFTADEKRRERARFQERQIA